MHDPQAGMRWFAAQVRAIATQGPRPPDGSAMGSGDWGGRRQARLRGRPLTHRPRPPIRTPTMTTPQPMRDWWLGRSPRVSQAVRMETTGTA